MLRNYQNRFNKTSKYKVHSIKTWLHEMSFDYPLIWLIGLMNPFEKTIIKAKSTLQTHREIEGKESRIRFTLQRAQSRLRLLMN